ncbi:hypothetical protein Goshw_004641, partial [Gossypium schwendimanii]|nr:hypothetical protein [Gossypium schwendimanii]
FRIVEGGQLLQEKFSKCHLPGSQPDPPTTERIVPRGGFCFPCSAKSQYAVSCCPEGGKPCSRHTGSQQSTGDNPPRGTIPLVVGGSDRLPDRQHFEDFSQRSRSPLN